ncbi:hypothetical protein HK405_012307, partial [Cladochytrium tenue]
MVVVKQFGDRVVVVHLVRWYVRRALRVYLCRLATQIRRLRRSSQNAGLAAATTTPPPPQLPASAWSWLAAFVGRG